MEKENTDRKVHVKGEFCDFYGLDEHAENTPEQIRNALVECFLGAHSATLENLKEYGKFSNEAGFEKVKSADVEMLIRKFFKESGGDYDRPDKKSLLAVIDKAAKFSENFRSQEVIRHNYQGIKKFIDKL